MWCNTAFETAYSTVSRVRSLNDVNTTLRLECHRNRHKANNGPLAEHKLLSTEGNQASWKYAVNNKLPNRVAKNPLRQPKISTLANRMNAGK